jgi:hypothetical protein
LACCILILAYVPALADSLESLVFVQPPPPAPPSPATDVVMDVPAIVQPPALPAAKASLDDDTPVIGVLASGRARAYLLEAFERGPASHIVNDVLGDVPISVTHCDLSGCTRLFTSDTPGRPLKLSGGGRRGHWLVLKFDGRLYRQETSQPLDAEGAAFPYSEYPAELTDWGVWRKEHPETDIYLGTADERTPADTAEPPRLSPHKPPSRLHHSS